jgi:O-antigen/teichoic acid export membrane protein
VSNLSFIFSEHFSYILQNSDNLLHGLKADNLSDAYTAIYFIYDSVKSLIMSLFNGISPIDGQTDVTV